jgi:hypothetical protein
VSISGTVGNASNNDLRGYFLMGMFAGAPGQVIDGGELYQNRTVANFSYWRNYRKNTMPNLSPNTLIPASLKGTWLTNFNGSFGIWDEDRGMSPSVIETTITNALRQVDEIAWNYSETKDYLTPGAVGQNWINAIWKARGAAGIPPPAANGRNGNTSDRIGPK